MQVLVPPRGGPGGTVGLEGPGRVQPRVPPSRGSSTGPAPPAASCCLPSPLVMPKAAEALDGVCVRGAGGRGSPRPRWAVWVARPESWVGRAPLPLISGAAGGVSRGAPLCRLAWSSGWAWPRVRSVLVYAALNARAAVPSPRVFLSASPRRAALLRGMRTLWLSGATRLSPGSWGTGVGERAG